MTTSDYSFGVSNPTIDTFVQKPFPSVLLSGTETSGGTGQFIEVAGQVWLVTNAVYNPALLGFTQQNTAQPSSALIVSPNGTITQATASASAANPIVWTFEEFSAPGFSVLDFGAVGNGVHDDTVGIQAAITACSAAGGGDVTFPTGQYLISGTISVPSNIRLLGAGRFVSIIKPTNAISSNVILAGPSPGNPFPHNAHGQGIVIENLQIDCSAIQTSNNVTAVNLGGTDYSGVRNCYIHNAIGYAIWFGMSDHSAADTTFNLLAPFATGNLLSNNGNNGVGADTIGGNNTTDELMFGNEFTGCYGTAIDRIFCFRPKWIANSSRVPSTTFGGHLWSDCGDTGGIIANNSIDQASIHIYGFLTSGTKGQPQKCLIVGNVITNPSSSGILFAAGNAVADVGRIAKYAVIADNYIENAFDNALVLSDAELCVVHGNVFNGWNANGASIGTQASSCIAVTAFGSGSSGSHQNRMSHNTFLNNTTNAQVYFESGAGFTAANQFEYNTISIPGSPGFTIDTTLPQCQIRNNSGMGVPGTSGTYWTKPTLPLTGVAVFNQTPHDQYVEISGGTVTQIAINGQAFTATSGMFYLAIGAKLVITYSGSPTTYNWIPVTT